MADGICSRLKLPTPEEMYQERIGKALSKGEPRIIANENKDKAKKQNGVSFRAAVWSADEGKSRASGTPLSKSGTDAKRVGDVHHVLSRSTNPDRVYDVSNGLLLSRFEHALAEANCPNDPAHHLLDIVGPENRRKPQRFIWRDKNGKILKERIG